MIWDLIERPGRTWQLSDYSSLEDIVEQKVLITAAA